MLESINLPLILIAATIAAGSPGPATLAIASTSMNSGRGHGMAIASGITVGSIFWSITAAGGMGAIMLTNAWVLEIIRYIGAAYLIYLAFKSARSAIASTSATFSDNTARTLKSAFLKGLAIHITNPKAVLFFGSLYAIAIPADASLTTLLALIVILAIQSSLVFHIYALIFSNPHVMKKYIELRRWFEGVFALAFGAAGIKILTTRIE